MNREMNDVHCVNPYEPAAPVVEPETDSQDMNKAKILRVIGNVMLWMAGIGVLLLLLGGMCIAIVTEYRAHPERVITVAGIIICSAAWLITGILLSNVEDRW